MKRFKLYDYFAKEGFYLTQGYLNNPRYYSQFGLLGHEGIDLGKRNDPRPKVRAVHDGIVVKDVDYASRTYGDYVVIWDDKQLCATYYCHLKENFVKVGQRVKAGDVIGIMGATGNITGKHLHFNFCITNKNGVRLYKNNKSKNKGFLDPMYPRDPAPPKKLGVDYTVEWVTPEDEVIGNNENYKGIDLNNIESVKVAIDVWKDVVDGKYKKVEDYNQLEEKYNSLTKEYNTLLSEVEDLKRIWKSKEVGYRDSLNECNELTKELREQLDKVAKKLNCPTRIEDILKTIEGLLNVEDRWQAAERDKTKLSNDYKDLNDDFSNFLQNLAKELNISHIGSRDELKTAVNGAIMGLIREGNALKEQVEGLNAKIEELKSSNKESKMAKTVRVAKKWYLSKTIWVNAVALVASVLASALGWSIPADVQLKALAVINLALRAVTKEKIEW